MLCMLGCAVRLRQRCSPAWGVAAGHSAAVSTLMLTCFAVPSPACPLPLLPQKSSNVLLTAGGTAKVADVAFSRELRGTFLSDLPLVGTFAW
jgi:hypothetical protein